MTATRAHWPVRTTGLLTVALFLILVGRFWHPVYGFTAFFQLDAPNDDLKIAAFRELPVYVHRDTGGYDGLYYAQIAHDPTLRDPELPRAMDNFGYRARRILPPALAWLLGGGQPAGIVLAYSMINIAAWLVLALVLWRLLDVRDASGWLAWAGVLFSAGALGSVRLALTDLVALAILAGALFLAERARHTLAAIALGAAGLARETSLLALGALLERPWFSLRNFTRALLVVAPLALWLAYIRWQVGPSDQGWANFTWPGAGLLKKWRDAVGAISQITDKPLAWTTLLATLALTVQAAHFIVRPQWRERWWRLGAAYAAMMLFFGTAVWEGFPGAATRVLLPLNLAFNVLVHRSRVSVLWLIAGNLTVFAGLLSLRDVPRDFRELSADAAGGAACIVRLGGGWFGREHTARHEWYWCEQRGALTLETWPRKRPVTVELQFALRSLAPRRVTLHQDGREIWHADVDTSKVNASVTLHIDRGTTSVDLSSDSPPVLENNSPTARRLAFALYDARVVVKE